MTILIISKAVCEGLNINMIRQPIRTLLRFPELTLLREVTQSE